jgi:hypothetical protein
MGKPQTNYTPPEKYFTIGYTELNGDLGRFLKVEELKTQIKVTITCDELYVKFMKEFQAKAKALNIKYGKKDRMGVYTEYRVYFSKELGPDINKFIKTL